MEKKAALLLTKKDTGPQTRQNRKGDSTSTLQKGLALWVLARQAPSPNRAAPRHRLRVIVVNKSIAAGTHISVLAGADFLGDDEEHGEEAGKDDIQDGEGGAVHAPLVRCAAKDSLLAVAVRPHGIQLPQTKLRNLHCDGFVECLARE